MTKLTPAQMEVLTQLDTRVGTEISGQRQRAAKKLVDEGLATALADGRRFKLTAAGKAFRKAA